MTTAALALDSQLLALDLLALLRELDPSRWKEELVGAFHARVAELSLRIDELLELQSATDLLHRAQADADARLQALRASWARVAEILEQHAPTSDLTPADLEAEWMELRSRLQGAYESLAADLRDFAIHLPHLRPTNYKRNMLHVGGAMIALAFVLVLFPTRPGVVLGVAGFMAGLAWTFETTRRFSAGMDRFTWWVFGACAHPHERYRINSGTWFTTSLLILAMVGSPVLATVALAVLGFGDPCAAIVGRRWGRTKLLHGRTAEGSLAFVTVGLLASVSLLSVSFPGLSFPTLLAVAGGGTVLGAVAEVVSKRVDDNLLVPMAAASGAAGVAWMLGLPL